MNKVKITLMLFFAACLVNAMEQPLARYSPQEATQELQRIIKELRPTRFLYLIGPVKLQWDKEVESLKTIKNLIDQGADIDMTNEDGQTILSIANMLGFSDAVKYLLGKNSNVNIPNSWPPLLEAARLEYEDIAQMLLDAGANVNQQGFNKSSALLLAVECGHKNIADLLLAYGANPHLKDAEGKSAFDAAANDPKMMKLFTINRFP